MDGLTMEEIRRHVAAVDRKLDDIDSRLRAVEQREQRIVTLLEGMTTKLEDGLRSASLEQDRTASTIYGDAKSKAPGLLIRVDRLEQDQARARWFLRTVATAVVSMAVAGLWALLKNS